jgi:hypothetical protein
MLRLLMLLSLLAEGTAMGMGHAMGAAMHNRASRARRIKRRAQREHNRNYGVSAVPHAPTFAQILDGYKPVYPTSTMADRPNISNEVRDVVFNIGMMLGLFFLIAKGLRLL